MGKIFAKNPWYGKIIQYSGTTAKCEAGSLRYRSLHRDVSMSHLGCSVCKCDLALDLMSYGRSTTRGGRWLVLGASS